LSAELREALSKPVSDGTPGRTIFDSLACAHCGGIHLRACPRVKLLRFASTGSGRPVMVEFWPEGEWSQDGVIWPEIVFGTVRVPDADDSQG
jgi:hypothetical protein